MTLYDSIGRGYGERRQQDPRLAEHILGALGGCRSILNVGAGAGSYEPPDRELVAVEPSMVMIRQRPSGAAPVVRGSAMDFPFRDQSFDAALAILTVHHWPDVGRGLEELRRVARRVVLLTFDTSVGGFWLTDYFPEILEIDRRTMPALSTIERHLGPIAVQDVSIPHDCTDGMLGAYWRRPHAYLDASVRSATSVFARMRHTDAGLSKLRGDLDSGAWHRRYGHFMDRSELDLGYRLVVAESTSASDRPSERAREELLAPPMAEPHPDEHEPATDDDQGDQNPRSHVGSGPSQVRERASATRAISAWRASSGVATGSGKARRTGRGPRSVTTDISNP